MGETVSVDKKGRLVLPKRVRSEAQIDVESKLVARAAGIGRVELFNPEILSTKAQEIGARKLAGWMEGEHEAAKYLSKSMKRRR